MRRGPADAASGPDAPMVLLTVWGVQRRYIPMSVIRIALDRFRLRPHSARAPGLRFAKLLGTGSGQTFTMRDADLGHWALLTVWDSAQDAAAFQAGPVPRAWNAITSETLTVEMVPLSSRGKWARQEPFAVPRLQAGPVIGPVAAITRARLRTSRSLSFWRAVPAIAEQLHQQDGVLLALSIGESPVGLMGTFSLWSNQAAMSAFAHRTPAHVRAIRQTGPQRWYAEELFARFCVRSVQGSYRGEQFAIPSTTAPVTEPAAGSTTGKVPE